MLWRTSVKLTSINVKLKKINTVWNSSTDRIGEGAPTPRSIEFFKVSGILPHNHCISRLSFKIAWRHQSKTKLLQFSEAAMFPTAKDRPHNLLFLQGHHIPNNKRLIPLEKYQLAVTPSIIKIWSTYHTSLMLREANAFSANRDLVNKAIQLGSLAKARKMETLAFTWWMSSQTEAKQNKIYKQPNSSWFPLRLQRVGKQNKKIQIQIRNASNQGKSSQQETHANIRCRIRNPEHSHWTRKAIQMKQMIDIPSCICRPPLQRVSDDNIRMDNTELRD